MLRLDSTTKNTKATLLHSPLLPPTIPEVNWRLKFSSGSTTIFFQQHLCNSLFQTFQGQEDFEECCWLHSIHQLATFKTTRFISHYNFFSWKKMHQRKFVNGYHSHLALSYVFTKIFFLSNLICPSIKTSMCVRAPRKTKKRLATLRYVERPKVFFGWDKKFLF